MRILLIGEAENLRRAEKGLKEPDSFGAKWVPSVNEALEQVDRFQFDVVVIGGRRAELVDTAIRIRDWSPNVPILVLPRRNVDSTLLDLLFDLGVARYLSPRVEKHELRKAVLEVRESFTRKEPPPRRQPRLLATHLTLKRQGSSWFLDLHYAAADGDTGVIRRCLSGSADELA